MDRRAPAVRLLSTTALLLGALSISTPARGSELRSVFDDPSFIPTLMSGLEAIYDLDLERGDAIFRRITGAHPEHPVGPLLHSQTTWWRILVDPTETSHDARFREALEQTIELSDRRLEKDPADLDALYFKATALAYRGRLRSLRHEWVPAAWDGKRALGLVRELHERFPENDDLYFGLGLYDYFAEVMPRRYPALKAVKPFFPTGDRERGLRRIRRAAREGTFSRTEASYFLFLIHYHFERDAAAAQRLIASLRSDFPGNSVYHVYEGRTRFRWGSIDTARRVFETVLSRFEAGRPGYTAEQGEAALYYLARCEMAENRYAEALPWLARLEHLAASRGSRFETLAHLRRGMTYDALGVRPTAVAEYRRTLELPDTGVAHEKARRYLRSPFVG